MAEPLSYQRDIQPIFTAKCVACHACYDSPCQLNLGSGEGVERGAHKTPLYNGTRTQAQETTRLFLDAQGEAAWRRKGFYSVLEGSSAQAALMTRMLELGRSQPLVPNARLPDALDIGIYRDNQCPLPDEFAAYAKANPHGGMPFAVTGLSEDEHATLQRWLAQGAPLDSRTLEPSATERAQIADWEGFLNGDSLREQLVGRWLYEHLFLAHLYFEGGEPGHFYTLVRSRTPSGQPIDPIATRRPNDDPGTDVYYRLRPVTDVIVHKTHLTYPLGAARLARVKALFFAEDWDLEQLPGYGVGRRANPFETFQAIPARARYQFMLDNAEYFVRTFIRGPVCRGQIATDVIRDQFWVFFQDPQHDQYIADADYRRQATPLLAMPGQLDNLGDLWGVWRAYRDKRNQYEELRRDRYSDLATDWSQIWRGNDNALLTVFRHHDSASVRKGLIGAVPQTLWWMDYPLLERTYYQLVVNFDVFGNVSHQAQTRLYFDLIRNGAELNFLRLLPADSRQALLDSWYEGGGQLKLWLTYTGVDTRTPSGLGLSEDAALPAFASGLFERFGSVNAVPEDSLNRCVAGACARAEAPPALRDAEQALSRLAARPAAELAVIHQLPDVSLLRVSLPDGSRVLYTLLRNRAHSNVAFMLGESLRYQPEKDSLTIYPGLLGSYPNFLFSLPVQDVPAFVAALEQVDSDQALEGIAARWGIRRSHPAFWDYFHDLSAYLREHESREAGVLDMNRYRNL
ncbi:MAG TPA: fatty acid cis/trans isomerase [Pseudomonas sp.]|nr:fatty acid cis/trans isomerase [Pseudomonas sp.]HTO17733.1 fatty acid cis/trans isomerase [Pseudomonas sp.]